MNIELSQHEIDLLDDALKAWANAPKTEGSNMSMMGSLLQLATRERDHPNGVDLGENAPEAVMRRAEQESKTRERTALLLRAKLAQASARASEHEIPNTPPHEPFSH